MGGIPRHPIFPLQYRPISILVLHITPIGWYVRGPSIIWGFSTSMLYILWWNLPFLFHRRLWDKCGFVHSKLVGSLIFLYRTSGGSSYGVLDRCKFWAVIGTEQRHCLSNGIIDAVWFSLPISVSKFLAFGLSFYKISWIVFIQAMNMVSGNLTHNVCVLYIHPKTTLISSNSPPAFAFDGLIISSLGTSFFELMSVRRRGLRVAFLRFLWLYCCQYQVWLLCNRPVICISFLEYWLIYGLLRVYSVKMVWICPGFRAGVPSLGLGLGFLVVPKCCPSGDSFQGLKLVQRFFSIWLVHLLHRKWVLVI